MRKLVAEDQRLYPSDIVLEGFDMVIDDKKAAQGDFFAGKLSEVISEASNKFK